MVKSRAIGRTEYHEIGIKGVIFYGNHRKYYDLLKSLAEITPLYP